MDLWYKQRHNGNNLPNNQQQQTKTEQQQTNKQTTTTKKTEGTGETYIPSVLCLPPLCRPTTPSLLTLAAGPDRRVIFLSDMQMNRRRLSAGELFIGPKHERGPGWHRSDRTRAGRAVLVTAAGAVPERGKNIHDGHMGAENTICAVITVVYRESYIQEMLAALSFGSSYLVGGGGGGEGGGGGWLRVRRVVVVEVLSAPSVLLLFSLCRTAQVCK